MPEDPPAIPPDALAECARSEHDGYRLAAALHPDTPQDAIDELVELELSYRRVTHVLPSRTLLAVARRPNLPTTTARSLLRSRVPNVRETAVSNAAFTGTELTEFAASADDAQVLGAAANPRTPPDVLELLCDRADRRHDLYVPRAVAGNPSASPHVLDRLARTEHDAELVDIAAANPGTPAETLRWLAETADPVNKKLLRIVAGNPSAPDDVRSYAALSSGPAR